MHATPEISPTLIAAPLWERARAVLARAGAATGGAAAIAAITVLPETLRRDIVRWLLLLEHLVRKLLLVEAARLPPPSACARAPRVETIVLAQRRPPWISQSIGDSLGALAPPNGSPNVIEAPGVSHRLTRLDAANPHSWPARFSFALPHNPRRVPEACAPRIRALWGPAPPPLPAPAPRTARVVNRRTAALRLALRFEAVRRVLADPLAHAERLAERLRRETRRFPELVTRYAIAPPRTSFHDPADPRLGADIYIPVFAAESKFGDSS